MAACLKRSPTHLQQQSLLRIHKYCVPAAGPEKSRIELIQTLNQANPPHVLPQRTAGSRIEMLSQISAIRRNLVDSIAPLQKQLPKVFRALNTTGQTAAHSKDSNRFLLSR